MALKESLRVVGKNGEQGLSPGLEALIEDATGMLRSQIASRALVNQKRMSSPSYPSSSRLAVVPLTTLCLAVAFLACTSSKSGPSPADTGVSSSDGASVDAEPATYPVNADTGPSGSDGASVDVQPAIYTVSGVAQKGPFGNGTQITIAECDDRMVPTGRTFTTSIIDNTGVFSLPNVQLFGKYVRLTADGFYFDEVANQLSVSRIALNALADVTNRSTVNVNLLTHLEQPRLEYLLASGGSFVNAKAQAQREVLAIFGFALSDSAPSETLDIARGTDDDAILLAVSAILQGRRTPGEITELLSNIATDIRNDGVLNSTALGSALMNEAVLLNLAAIRSNLVQRYSLMGVTATIGDFEKYVKAFINAAKYPVTSVITYPATGVYGQNFLDPTVTTFPVVGNLAAPGGATPGGISFLADLPRGTSLKILLRGQGGAMWAYAMGRTSCWTVTAFDPVHQEQTYSIAGSSNVQSCDLNIFLMPTGMGSANPVDAGPAESCIKVDYYENFELAQVATPTASKLVCDDKAVARDGGADVSAGSLGTLDAGVDASGMAGVDASGMASCGDVGLPCCAGNACDGQSVVCAPLQVSPSTMQCQLCGGFFQPCCPSSTCSAPSIVCAALETNPQSLLCQPCGGPGQRCCAGNSCNDSVLTVCMISGGNAGTCQPCGQIGMACCAGNACGGPATSCVSADASAGTCQAVGREAQDAGVAVDAGDDADQV